MHVCIFIVGALIAIVRIYKQGNHYCI